MYSDLIKKLKKQTDLLEKELESYNDEAHRIQYIATINKVIGLQEAILIALSMER